MTITAATSLQVSLDKGQPLAPDAQQATVAAAVNAEGGFGSSAVAPAASDTVNITPQAMTASQQFEQMKQGGTLSATTPDGIMASVSGKAAPGGGDGLVFSMTLNDIASGTELTFGFAGDISVARTADGGYFVQQAGVSGGRMFSADGTVTALEQAPADARPGMVYVSTTGAALKTGDGGSTVFVLGDGAAIAGGDGNDTLVLRKGIANVTFDGGDGDDRVQSEGAAYDSVFNLGAGNNALSLEALEGGAVSAADGDNSIRLTKMAGGASIVLGDGDNALRVWNAGGAPEGTRAGSAQRDNGQNGVSITLGNGDNSMDGYLVTGASSVTFGNGNNRFNYYALREDASVSFGGGNNTVKAYELSDRSTLSAGNGDNLLRIYEVEDSGSLLLGNGNNIVDLYSAENDASLNFGDGNNSVRVYESTGRASVNFGHGKNNLKIYQAMNDSAINFGNGNNEVLIYEMLHDSSLALGDGDNTVMGYSLGDRSRVSVGSGDNLMFFFSMKGDASIELGSGKNMLLVHQLMSGSVSGGENSTVFDVSSEKDEERLKQTQQAWNAAVDEHGAPVSFDRQALAYENLMGVGQFWSYQWDDLRGDAARPRRTPYGQSPGWGPDREAFTATA